MRTLFDFWFLDGCGDTWPLKPRVWPYPASVLEYTGQAHGLLRLGGTASAAGHLLRPGEAYLRAEYPTAICYVKNKCEVERLGPARAPTGEGQVEKFHVKRGKVELSERHYNPLPPQKTGRFATPSCKVHFVRRSPAPHRPSPKPYPGRGATVEHPDAVERKD